MEASGLQISDFERPDIPSLLTNLPADEIDGAGFGIIGLMPGGEVISYNAFEQRLAGLSAESVLGRDFFVEVAPCTNNFLVRERFIAAWERGEPLDALLPYTFSYRMKSTKVILRMIVHGDHSWLLVKLV